MLDGREVCDAGDLTCLVGDREKENRQETPSQCGRVEHLAYKK